MSEKRFTFVDNIFKYLETGIKDNKSDYDSLNGESVVDLLNELVEETEELKQSNDRFADTVAKQVSLLIELRKENERLRMKLKGDDYMMVSEMLSSLRKTGICDGCKHKDKPVEWYLENGLSVTAGVCDRYEPED